MQKKLKKKLFDLYSHTGFITRGYIGARMAIAGFDHILKRIPNEGAILDIGCGYGVLSNIIALSRPGVNILGVDNNVKRIRIAKSTMRGRNNISFEAGDAQTYLIKKKIDTVVFFDVLHHIPKDAQIAVLEDVLRSLPKNATVLVKEINTHPFWKYCINYIHDRMLNGLPLHFRDAKEWQRVLKNAGFTSSIVYYGPLYPHVLIYGKKY